MRKVSEMEAKAKILTLIGLLNIFILSGTDAVDVRFYQRENFQEIFWISNSTADCNEMYFSRERRMYSYRADTCFITYNNHGCKSGDSFKFMPGAMAETPKKLHVYSWHICDETEGGNQLNVDITEYEKWGKVIHSFKNICSCVNVPEFVQIMTAWSVNNHHNAMFAYYEPNCSVERWNATYVAAGFNEASGGISRLWNTDSVTKITYKIRSFGPDPNSPYFQTSCKSVNFQTGHENSMVPESPENFKKTTESVMDAEDGVAKAQIPLLTTNFAQQPKTQVDQSKGKQDDSQNAMKSINDKLDKLAEKLAQFQENVESSLIKLNLTCNLCECE